MKKITLLFALVFICSSLSHVEYAHAGKKHSVAKKKAQKMRAMKKSREMQISDSFTPRESRVAQRSTRVSQSASAAPTTTPPANKILFY